MRVRRVAKMSLETGDGKEGARRNAALQVVQMQVAGGESIGWCAGSTG